MPTKVHVVKAKIFPVVMYECENWNIEKTECQRTDVFKLWCWIRCLRVPWTSRRSNQSIQKGINLEYSLEGLMLKHQYFDHLVQSWLIWKGPDAGKDWWHEEKGVTENEMVGWHHWLNGLGLSKLQEIVDRKPGTLHSTGLQRVRQDLATEHQQQYNLSIPDSFSSF